MLLLDRGRWLVVLQWAFWINTWHEQLYYRVIHGDKVSSIRGAGPLSEFNHTWLQYSTLLHPTLSRVLPLRVEVAQPNLRSMLCRGPQTV